jgi:Tol biopolymer transport system component
MTPERYRQIGELYHAALEVDEDDRAAFLERACAGDEEMRREVESLVISHEEAADFIAEPALAVAAELLADGEADALTGQAISHYRILSLIGAGGMGQVYLAEDTQLGRRVALKFLPEHFTSDSERVRRFRQEARAASALNHPNIITIHEIGQAGQRHYIATEYIEGETLRDRLDGRRLRPFDALDVAAQMASALAAAHEAGIVHRDVKPENVMIRRDGYVKVLDFGLAKLTERPSVDVEAPTVSMVKTDPGRMMGTVTYMSPEQARGLQVDARTDVWSLGVVLYEMIAGRRPFEGATTSDVIVSILEKEPEPLLRHASEAPAELERIVTKALTKNTDERYQTIKDMAIDLRRLRRRVEVEAEIERSGQPGASGDATVATGNAGQRAAQTSVQAAAPVSAAGAVRTTSSVEYVLSEIKGHKRGAVLVGAALILLFSSVGYVLNKLPHRPEPAAAPFQTTKMTRLTATGKARDAAISPDGKYIVYAEEDNKQQSLWVRQVATGSNIQIIPPADVNYFGLTFSNDSNYVYYVRNEKDDPLFNLYQVPALGGASRKLIDRVDSAVAFSPDSQRLAFVRDYDSKKESALVIFNTDGSGERTLSTRKFPDSFYIDDETRIAWSPDAKIIACPASRIDANGEYYNIVGVRVEDGSEESLTSQKWGWVSQVAWLSDGSGLVILAAELAALKVSLPYSMQLWHLSYPGGNARRITNDLNSYRAVGLTADSNSLVTVQTNRVSNIWIAPQADLSRARQITSGTLEGNSGLTWTLDGRIVYRSNASGKPDIWMMDVDGSNRRRLTHEGQSSTRPTVSPDGRYIVFGSDRAGKLNIWRMDMDGGNPKQLTDGKLNINPHLSPDGRWVVYQSRDAGEPSLWKVPIEGGDPVQLNDTISNLPVVSPDGKQIACFYWDDQANPTQGIMIFPFEGGQPTKRLKTLSAGPDAFVLHWTPDGRALLYIDTRLSNIWSQPVDGGEPVQLTDFQYDQVFNFDWSPDGKWLAAARGRVTHDVVLISDLR